MTYTADFTNVLKRNLNSISNVEAKEFLLKHGYIAFDEMLPEYYRVSGLDRINLEELDWTKNNPNVCITKPLLLTTPKGNLSWRDFSFNHPYIFIHLVNEITKPDSWDFIKEKLCKPTLVNSYSVPIFKIGKKKKLTGLGISHWIQMSEKDILKDSGIYRWLTVTDIQSFYPSIYTHSIVWAIHTKAVAKLRENRNNYSLLGNKLDKLFMHMNDGQTNGIPIGSLVSDIVAEVILSDVDEKITDKITKIGLDKKVIISRFRDDYRILSLTEHDGMIVLKIIGEILRAEYNLQLNPLKTKSFQDIIEGSFRPEFMAINNSPSLRDIYNDDFSYCYKSKGLKQCLLELYVLQKQYPQRNAALSLINKIGKHFHKNPDKFSIKANEIRDIIGILQKLTLINERMTPSVYLLLNKLLEKITSTSEREKVLKTISFIMLSGTENAFQLIWYHRLCWAIAPDLCIEIHTEHKHPLLEVLRNRKADYKVMFSNCSLGSADKESLKEFTIINREKQNKYKKKAIDPNSISPFGY